MQNEGFDVPEYIENPTRQIITRDCKPARIICTNVKGKYPIIALVDEGNDVEYAYKYTKDGLYASSTTNSRDLFFVSEKKKCWVNVYMEKDGTHTRVGAVYNSKEEALEHMSIHEYIGTVSFDLEF